MAAIRHMGTFKTIERRLAFMAFLKAYVFSAWYSTSFSTVFAHICNGE